MSDTFSILTHSRYPQTKIWKSESEVIFPPDKSKHFTLETHKVDGIHTVSALLTRLEKQTKSHLIRGKYAGDEVNQADPEYVEGKVRRTLDIFEDQALHTILIEVDKFKPLLDCPVSDPVACIEEYIHDALPECFRGISYHWQLSSSAGKRGNEIILKVHIWFWLEIPYTSAQLKAWAASIKLDSDHSVFNPVQIHFTANPIFEEGVRDPVPTRSGFVQGDKGDAVLLKIDTSELIIVDKPTRQHMLSEAIKNDPIAMHLNDNGYVKSVGHLGQLHIDCPFKEGHSIESTETSTNYFPANTGGYKYGAFHCFHQSCANRTKADFLEKIGCEDGSVLYKADHMGAAYYIVQSAFTVNGKIAVMRYNGEWYQFNGRCYNERDEEAMRSLIWQLLDKSKQKTKDDFIAPFLPKQTDITGVLDATRAIVRHEHLVQNTWVSGVGPKDCVSMGNGILDITTRKLLPHSPDFFTLNALPYNYIEHEMPKDWLGFLDDTFEGDKESIETLQEFFGYCITPLANLHKMLMLLGPTRSGKSTISHVITAMLGYENVSGASFSSLSNNFGLQPLRGKLLGIFADVRVGGRSDIHGIIEKLLCISGEDNVIVDQKYKTQWSGVITARLMLISNEAPQLFDASNALIGRFIFLETRNSYLGKEDIDLPKRLLTELPQIFNWALIGRERLLARKSFIQPAFSAYIASDMKRLGNPIAAFVEDRCVVGSEHEIEKQRLFDAYKYWCHDNGHKFPKTMSVFARDLKSSQPSIEPTKKSHHSERIPSFRGIDLLSEKKEESEI
jgi:P4 family phage/plasmid primase-like protien